MVNEDIVRRCEKEREVPGEARGLVVRYGYKEWGNMGCFRNPIVVSGSVLCNILYCIVESFSLIRGRRHAFVGTTTSIRAFAGTTTGIRASNLLAKTLLLPLFQSLFSETMSDISNESTTVPQPSLNNPIITDSSKISPTTLESHSVQITTIRLNGDNFLRWSQSVRMYIRGRGNIGYLTGEKKAPAVDDPNYAIWDNENSMVMTWLVNSMEEDINSNYMCYPTAQELWENVNQMYSDLGNQSQTALLKSNLTSGTSSVSLAHTGSDSDGNFSPIAGKELGLKISGRVKDHKAHKMKTKVIFTEGGVDCSFVVI
ncbi:hypothetical protein CK203_032913 [Vitis vinifera]|uniref:Retrotransposon Copia-like N-terminal domain-containing protein n=1 Tax=Vitis vinifera TaxID=29760 RepID=A0A438HL23_VITVI|nr:hypothetical protein CK203_032913 [Vitis vinifera]